ncbi:hypothetical protein OROHE_026476 [Orobanche hederae]
MGSAAYYTTSKCELAYENYQTHFLDSCFLCRKPLGQNHDIFMYRGNTPFCSPECRQEQIETDEGCSEKKDWSSSSSKRSKTERQVNSEYSTNKESKASTRTAAAAAAVAYNY